jgi:hypothetical protein
MQQANPVVISIGVLFDRHHKVRMFKLVPPVAGTGDDTKKKAMYMFSMKPAFIEMAVPEAAVVHDVVEFDHA